MTPRRTALSCALCAVASASAVATAPAAAATQLVVKGAGFGHGVGMSQYGAYGYAQKGADYKAILAHYYTGTTLGTVTSAGEVTVLLRSSPTAAFTGASTIGTRALDPAKTYSVKVKGAGVELRSPTGRPLATFAGPVRIANGASPVKLMGAGPNGVQDGLWRGALEFRPSGTQLLVIDALSLEDYVRGVVSRESPSSWPAEALKAQAVAARGYALTTSKAGAGFQQYADTRSQVYAGVAAETAATDAAVAQTDGQVVTYIGKPVTTYFFSTSGGRTENVENSFIGASPSPWLRSVEDPYDAISPKHRWSMTFTIPAAQAKLGGLVKGTLTSIKVTKRGVSPRVVSAQVVGTGGSTTVSGPTLRAKLGLYDTWATFSTISTKVGRRPVARTGAVVPTGRRTHDGVDLRTAALSVAPSTPSGKRVYRRVLVGAVVSAKPGDWLQVERRGANGRFRRAFWTSANRGGRFRASLNGPGVYRIYWRGLHGPPVRAR